VARIRIGEIAAPLAVGSDAVWVLDDLNEEVIKVDPRTETVVGRFGLTSALDRIVIGEGSVWILDTGAGILTSIREEDGDVGQVVNMGPGASDVAVGFGSVWVAQGGSVLGIDPTTRRIDDRIELGPHRSPGWPSIPNAGGSGSTSLRDRPEAPRRGSRYIPSSPPMPVVSSLPTNSRTSASISTSPASSNESSSGADPAVRGSLASRDARPRPHPARARPSSSRLSRLWPGRNSSIEGSAAAIPRASGS